MLASNVTTLLTAVPIRRMNYNDRNLGTLVPDRFCVFSFPPSLTSWWVVCLLAERGKRGWEGWGKGVTFTLGRNVSDKRGSVCASQGKSDSSEGRKE
jgi:hypothetical protein